ncbi:MAG: hypothetical protein M3071_11625 [Actinomycetota bacterium]|nr:hypothetical protein [Actinomycetota bacterium]
MAFGEPDGELFGTATVWDGGSCSSFGAPVHVEGHGPDDEWRIFGDGIELTFVPVGEAAELELAEAGIASVYQLARVHGTVALDGGRREVDCAGQRTRRLGALDPKRFCALRAVSAWFGDTEGVAVLAARPRRAKGHDSELLDGVLLEGGVPVRVTEPRLSSTYTADGVPSRVGLELWLGEVDSEQHARRAAGEAIGRPAACEDPGLRSELLRWRMQSRVGVGVYELFRAR